MEELLAEAFHSVEEVLIPSYFGNEHRNRFDWDRVDALNREGQLHVDDDIFADKDALANDYQAYAVGVEHALDALADVRTLNVVVDDDEVLAFHPFQLLREAYVVVAAADACLDVVMKAEGPYWALDDILKSFHLAARHGLRHFHY